MFPRASASLIVTAPLSAIPSSMISSLSSKSLHNYGVLMVKRVSTGSFEGAHVFPGGLEEPQDTCQNTSSLSALQICALRETFEETGLLLTDTLPPDSIITRGKSFHEMCTSGVRFLDPQGVGRWVTPRAQKKRFDTSFFIVNIGNNEQSRRVVDQLRRVRVQESEVVQVAWVQPDEALQANMQGKLPLFPPQFYMLSELGRVRRWQALAAQVGDNRRAVEPVLCGRSDGMTVALLPGDKAYEQRMGGGDGDLFCEAGAGPLHRLVMRKAESGGFHCIRLLQTIQAQQQPSL
ncbi:NUDIX domain-containing protein [Kickxella alabastrina]|uniref:NUDIX domain-containing protein n=1 Tax=Kickxella alabastrina TaxID=61397 RepID=UPI0022204C32|nr:NUDIX domain-containing protein [Kickxella alabastrina]KAI7834051.1 NUDIX domain-containing protein [Kickxella alabastrina]KAJ1933069.1 hypothetical protein GGF37_006848 [Kickxella alabastrina]